MSKIDKYLAQSKAIIGKMLEKSEITFADSLALRSMQKHLSELKKLKRKEKNQTILLNDGTLIITKDVMKELKNINIKTVKEITT